MFSIKPHHHFQLLSLPHHLPPKPRPSTFLPHASAKKLRGRRRPIRRRDNEDEDQTPLPDPTFDSTPPATVTSQGEGEPLRGLDVLLAMRKAAERKKMKGGRKVGSRRGREEEEKVGIEDVRGLVVREDWEERLDRLEREIKELQHHQLF